MRIFYFHDERYPSKGTDTQQVMKNLEGQRLVADHLLYPAGLPVWIAFLFSIVVTLTLMAGRAYLLDREFFDDALRRRTG